ncbi:hypothetical protein PENTCL1PPCAC_1370, partial [Pristionchus entomophagus]
LERLYYTLNKLTSGFEKFILDVGDIVKSVEIQTQQRLDIASIVKILSKKCNTFIFRQYETKFVMTPADIEKVLQVLHHMGKDVSFYMWTDSE